MVWNWRVVKSRLIEFGRFAEQNRRAKGEHKPETFDFLGFTFYCTLIFWMMTEGKMQSFLKKHFMRKKLDPQMHVQQENNNAPVADEVDPELLAKVLANPEMRALLNSLAKTMK